MSEPSVPENLIIGLAEQAGVRDKDEAEEYVFGLPEIDEKKDQKNIPIKEPLVDYQIEEPLSSEKKMLLGDIQKFIEETTKDFQATMDAIMRDYRKGKGKDAFTLEMQIKMQEKGYDLPRFTVMDGEQAREFLEEMAKANNDSVHELSEDGYLVVFNLPRPLARFWYKGGTDSWGSMSKETAEDEVEWGHFYRNALPTIWDCVGYQECEGNLNFERINFIGEHDPKKYYYVWDVSKHRDLSYYYDE